MSSIKTLYTGPTPTITVRPLTKGSVAYPYKAPHFGNDTIEIKTNDGSIKHLYNHISNDGLTKAVEFVSYNDDYSIPKKPKILYPKKNQKS